MKAVAVLAPACLRCWGLQWEVHHLHLPESRMQDLRSLLFTALTSM